MRALSALMTVFLLTGPPAGAVETIVVDQANPPFMYQADGKVSGVYPTLVREVFRRMGEDVELSAVPWRRAMNEARSGACGIVGIRKNSVRLTLFDFSDKLYDEVIVVYVAKGKAFPFTGAAALEGRVVGVIRGWTYGEEFDSAVKAGRIKTEEVSGDRQNFEMLAAGRVDAILVNRESAEMMVSSGAFKDKVEALSMPLLTLPSFLAFSKTAQKADLIARFNASLAAMHGDGSFDRITSANGNPP
jgi:polar amino acid transport system substrate-binding protein